MSSSSSSEATTDDVDMVPASISMLRPRSPESSDALAAAISSISNAEQESPASQADPDPYVPDEEAGGEKGKEGDTEMETEKEEKKNDTKPAPGVQFDSTHEYSIRSKDFGTDMYVTMSEALDICTRIQKLRAKGWGMAVPMHLSLFDSTVAASVGYLSDAEIRKVAERQEKEGLVAGIKLIPCKNAECTYKKMQISVDPACSEDCYNDNAFEVYKSVYWRDDNKSDKTVSAYSARSPPSALLWCNNPWRVCDNCLDLDEKKGYVDPMRKHIYDTHSINTDEQYAELACDECCESTFDHISAVNRVTWRRAHDFKELPVLGDGKIMLEKPSKTIEQVTDEEKQAAEEAKAAESTKAAADGDGSDSELEAEDEYDYKNGDWNNGYVYDVNEEIETGFRIPASEFKRIHNRINAPTMLASELGSASDFMLIDQSVDADVDDPEIDYLTEAEYERVSKYNTPEKQAELAKLAKVIPKQTDEDKQIRFHPRHKFAVTLRHQPRRKVVPTIEEARQIYARLHREDDDNFMEADREKLSKSELHNENTIDSHHLTVSEEKMIVGRLAREDKAAFVFDPKTSYMVLEGSTDFYKPTPEEAKPIAARLWPSRFDSDKELRTSGDLQLYNETEETFCGYLTAEEAKFVRGRHAFDEAEKNANGAPVFHEEDTYVVCDNSGTELTTLTKEEALDIITRIRKDGGEAWAVYKAHDEDQLKHLDIHPATGRPDRWELQQIVEGIEGNDQFAGYLDLEEQKDINLRMQLDREKYGYVPLANPRKFARLNGDEDTREPMDTKDEKKAGAKALTKAKGKEEKPITKEEKKKKDSRTTRLRLDHLLADQESDEDMKPEDEKSNWIAVDKRMKEMALTWKEKRSIQDRAKLRKDGKWVQYEDGCGWTVATENGMTVFGDLSVLETLLVSSRINSQMAPDRRMPVEQKDYLINQSAEGIHALASDIVDYMEDEEQKTKFIDAIQGALDIPLYNDIAPKGVNRMQRRRIGNNGDSKSSSSSSSSSTVGTETNKKRKQAPAVAGSKEIEEPKTKKPRTRGVKQMQKAQEIQAEKQEAQKKKEPKAKAKTLASKKTKAKAMPKTLASKKTKAKAAVAVDTDVEMADVTEWNLNGHSKTNAAKPRTTRAALKAAEAAKTPVAWELR